MFTGIVEEVGKVRYIQLNGNSGVLAVKAAKVLEGTKIGDSIAVNGVCLTVTSCSLTDLRQMSWQRRSEGAVLEIVRLEVM